MKKLVCCLIGILLGMISNAQDAKVSTGKLERFANFESKYVDSRNIDVWIPGDYSPKEKYAVIYMHDGQALYDASTTWNKQAWEVDEAAGKLYSANKVQKFIVVGIWNAQGKRHPEYFPQKPYESLSQTQRDTITAQLQKAGRTSEIFKPFSDLYLKFLVEEVKPFIDKTFSTKTDMANTFVAGSSMGGLISLYAICEYPEVFGGAACISTHWPGTFSVENNPIPNTFFNYMKTHLPNPKNHEIYFDCGDQTLDALYPQLQKKADAIMVEKGYTAKNFMSKVFPGKDHTENSWAERLHIPLEFLLKRLP